MYENDEKLIAGIKESLDFLDDSIEVNTPDLNQFIKLVAEVEEEKQTGKNMQFIIFIITAAFVICMETYSFYRSFVFFVIVQAAAILCILPALMARILKKRKQVMES